MRLLKELTDSVKRNYKNTEKHIMRRVRNSQNQNTFVQLAQAHVKYEKKK